MTDKQIAAIHKVNSDSTRWDIIEYLKFHKDVSTQELADLVHCDLSTLSFHLAKLKKVKLITAIKKGKFYYYNANFKTLKEIYEFMETKVSDALIAQSKYDFTKQEILDFYALYADHIRWNILNCILSHPGISGKQIKALTRESEANISFHVKKLLEGKIISSKKIQNQHYYWANVKILWDFHDYIGRTKDLDIWNKK